MKDADLLLKTLLAMKRSFNEAIAKKVAAENRAIESGDPLHQKDALEAGREAARLNWAVVKADVEYNAALREEIGQ